MSIVSSAWQFAKRHKGKLVVMGVATGGIVYLNRFLSSVERNWERSASKDFVADVRRKDTHFENSMRTCNSTCSSLVPKIVENLDELLDAEPLVEQLNVLKSNPEKQIELWKELSVLLFTRAVSEVYCLCFFVCYLRVQLLVIAGYIYADSCQESSSSINHNIQLKYVSLLNDFYDDGIREILSPVREAVQSELKNLSLKKALTTTDVQEIFDQIRARMTLFLTGPDGSAARILLKTERIASLSSSSVDDDGQVTLSGKEAKALETLMKETQDLLETQDFSRTLTACIDVAFSHMLDLLVACFVPDSNCSPADSTASQFSNLHTVHIPLLKLLPLMRQVLYQRTSVEEKQSLVRHLLRLDILNCYSANVYEAFCDGSNHTGSLS